MVKKEWLWIAVAVLIFVVWLLYVAPSMAWVLG